MTRDLSLPKTKRLVWTAEFERVRRRGSKVRGGLISVAVLRDGDVENWRAGFITSRKVGNAVARNRVRRRLREIVRRHQKELVDGVWIVTIASSRAVDATYRELEAEWLRLAERASILAA